MPEAMNESTEQLRRRLDRTQRELDTLYEISRAMRTTLELDHILYIILTGVTSHDGLGYNRAALYLVEPESRSLECRMAIGPESGEDAGRIWAFIETAKQRMDDLIHIENLRAVIQRSRLYRTLKSLTFPLGPRDRSLLKTAFERGRPWILSPRETAAYAEDPFIKLFRSPELLIMPLRTKDGVKGLIVADNLYTRKPITPEDLRIFSMLADQAALAIENSRLYEMTVLKSRTDPVTGLWNHGYFQEKLTESLKAAREEGAPLSLVIGDLDDFKKLNDTHGHQHGDRILKEVARLLREASREIDLVCRYGGEEFAVILRRTPKAHAAEIAERLRRRIAGHPFPSPEGLSPLRVTISLGVASFPDDASSKEDLIAAADRAMYIAKFGGKNRTQVFERKD